MNKKEVLEIRKQFSPEKCAIDRIAGCYVDGEKEKRMEREEAFLSLPEEQAFKYFDIFKKMLSGKIGKNLLNLEYKLKESGSSDQEGEEHELLMNLRESKLRDPALLDEFYEKILTSYDCAEDYDWLNKHHITNKALIRENLRNVARMGFQVANEVK